MTTLTALLNVFCFIAVVHSVAHGPETGLIEGKVNLTQLIERVKRRSHSEFIELREIAEESEREDRHLGSALFNLGKLTLTNIIKNSNKINISLTSEPDSEPSKISTIEEVESSNSLESPATAHSGDQVPPVRSCTTPKGGAGKCRDLKSCPALLLKIDNLRKSICFQSLFLPGVCCPDEDVGPIESLIQQLVSSATQQEPTTTTSRPTTRPTTKPTTKLPVIVTPGSTKRPQVPLLNPIINAGPTAVEPARPFAGQCGQVLASSFRVVGGDLSMPGKWPWMTAIYLHGPKGTEFWCGGTLINENFVLTAAHCTLDGRQKRFRASQYTVTFGEFDLKKADVGQSQSFKVSEIRVHPRFSGTGFYNDLALFKLERPVRFTQYIQPICLPAQSQRRETFVAQVPTIVGWGTTYYGGRESTLLREVQLPVWRNEDCDRSYLQPITEVFVCAGYADGGKDACQGDSGGPLMLKQNGAWTQIGIVSFGNKCAEPGFPGVYTRLTNFLDWIDKNAA